MLIITIMQLIVWRALEAVKTTYMVGWRWFIPGSLIGTAITYDHNVWNKILVIPLVFTFFFCLVTGFSLYMFPIIRLIKDADVTKRIILKKEKNTYKVYKY